MIAIISEKPSVGLDIARVVGADTRNDGYCSGNGYMVTWALGHLVSLAMPDTYGYTKTAAEEPADAAGPVPSGLQTGTHGQGNGYGHRLLETAESHRKRIQPL